MLGERMGDIRQIVLGEVADKPALVLRPVQILRVTGREVEKGEPIWRALGALQTLPEVLIAAQVHSSRLMEVVIHGDLIPSADSAGFRAFAIGDHGIVEQAKLFDPNHLTALVDGALLWRFVSIAVAQKHLADISERLANIERGISMIAQFQNDEQKSKIVGSLDYLRQTTESLAGGERSQAVKMILESIEREMGGIQRHIEESFHRRLDEPIKDKNYLGYESLSSGFQRKLDDLESFLKRHQLAGLTRVAALRVLAAYPGESALKMARAAAISESAERCKRMAVGAEDALKSQTEGWSGDGERARSVVVRRGKKVLRMTLPGALYEVVTGKGMFSEIGGTESLTPELDKAKSLAQAKAHHFSVTERDAASKLANACALTSQLALEVTKPERFLVEWGNGEPVSVQHAMAD